MFQSRTLKHYGGLTALLALCFQLILSFGHIHPEEIFGRNGSGLNQATTVATALGQHDQTFAESDICDICAAATLLASGQLPDPPSLPARETYGSIKPAFEPAQLSVERPFRLFQTRAPPVTEIG
jgi:hypothetical protein